MEILRAGRWTSGVLDKHGREARFEKSTRQGAGATLLHFTILASLRTCLHPRQTRSLLTVHKRSLHAPPTRSASNRKESTKLLSIIIKTLILATRNQKHSNSRHLHTMRRRHVPQTRGQVCPHLVHTSARCHQSAQLRIAHSQGNVPDK